METDPLPIDGEGWRELDGRKDSWHSVWLAWMKELNIVAVVMADTVHNTVYFDDGGIAETSEERVRAAVVPNEEAKEAFVHPDVYIRWFGRIAIEGGEE